MTNNFTPDIVAFCCHYCAYAAADLAGSMRLEYSSAIKVIELPCSGKLDTLYVLRAFEDGADAVYVAGCLEGNCHFLEGNYRAKKRVYFAKKLLDEIGLGSERLEMYNMSAAMAQAFAEAANEMTERARKLGPNPLKAK